MISYSDYILSQKPWGYWPLSDDSLTIYDENHTIIDCSGNEKHLIAEKTGITYKVPMPNTLHDSLPLIGMTVSSSPGFNPESFPGVFKISGYHNHVNDVQLELSSYNITHSLWRKRRRIEMLHVNGVIAIGNCIVLQTAAYYKVIQFRKEDRWYPSIKSYLIAQYPEGKRTIVDVEWIDEQNILVSVAVNGAIVVLNSLVSLPDLTTPSLYYRFVDDSWNRIGIISGTVSNLSVYYDKKLSQDYVVKSWNALSTPFIPSFFPMTIHLNDCVDTCRILSSHPNSAAHQLDTLLVRGMSHRMFAVLTAEPLGNGNSEIGLWLNTTDIEYGGGSQISHDFHIGDIIFIDGTEQNRLNGHWKVERLGQTSIYFSVVGEDYENEEGYFLIKRSPVGGGAWVRNADKEFTSLSSTIQEKMVINDINKNYSVLSLKVQPPSSVFLRRFYKRGSGHYLGEDLDSNKIHWSIIGDNLRFILTIAYKQNSKTHCRTLVFGDLIDVNDNKLKTILEGYISEQMGDVGFNKMFEYSSRKFTQEGAIHLQFNGNQTSNIGWIVSNTQGDVEYLHGTRDGGQHVYSSPIPFLQV